MDAPKFDTVARGVAVAPSRRATLRQLIGSALGGLFVAGHIPTEGKKGKKKDKNKGKKRKRKKKGKQGANTPNFCAGLSDSAFCDQFIGGNALPLISAGTPGALSVVAVGPYDGNILPFAVRNNTGKDVHDLSATATVRNAAGQLIGSGSDQEIEPNVVRAGSLSMGYIYFRGVDFPLDARYSISVSSDGADDWQYENERDLVFGEANYIDGRVVGTMTNGYNHVIDGPIEFTITCFDAAGRLLSQDSEYSGFDTLSPGQQDFFQFSSFGEPLECPYYLVSGSGFTP